MNEPPHLVDEETPPPGIPKEVHHSIWKAIKNRHLVRFFYHGKERISEPHDYGINKGRVRLFSYQLAGESTHGRLPDWRMTDVGGIREFKILDSTFPGNGPAPSGQHLDGDQVFIRVGETPAQPTKQRRSAFKK